LKTSGLVRSFALLVAMSSVTSILAVAQGPQKLRLMPEPASVTQGSGQFVVDQSFAVELKGFTDQRLIKARQRFLDTLQRETGIPFWKAGMTGNAATVEAGVAGAKFVVETAGRDKEIVEVGEDESYHLEVKPDGVKLTAANPLGAMHGFETFVQLVQATPEGFAAPEVTIDDKPRFPWRGLMIDSGRHFIPVPVIERNLDAMEAVKLNVFHWHLSENQGFRVESKVFPLLQQKGSDGLFYTQAEVKHIVEYARDRGIRVVPEFDMPGHATAWFVGYPNLASGKGPYEIERHWGVMDPAMDPTRESTYQFLNLLIGEMAGLFPDAYFHIGGDECNGKEWDRNERIQAWMKEHKIKDNAALQAYFSGRVQKLVTAHHKIMMGWDEVLQPDTPKDVVIQSWRGRASLLDAAQRGYKGVLSNGYYIDLCQPASEHYLVDPLEGIADKLTPAQTASILGGEATMWSEYVNWETMDSRVWPRTAAIAERFWSAENVRDVEWMYARLPWVLDKLTAYGVDPRSTTENMLVRLSGDPDPKALRVLASVVEPPRGYARGGLREHTQQTPLNHLVDAVDPESATAREFRGIAEDIAAGKATPEEVAKARMWLTLWRDNNARLEPKLGYSEMTEELKPVSATLKQVAEIGLAALDALEQHKALGADAQSTDLATLTAAEKPQALVILAVVKPVETLVNQAKGR
jgi:hexosaminidase